jgi:hypothetical protein
MRKMISGMVAAMAVLTASAVPASACGYGGCCGGAFAPCAPIYAPAYAGCGGCGWAYERLAEPETQYYYVNQGPTFSGPGMFAPYPVYRENALPVYYWRHHYRHHARADAPVLRRSY